MNTVIGTTCELEKSSPAFHYFRGRMVVIVVVVTAVAEIICDFMLGGAYLLIFWLL